MLALLRVFLVSIITPMLYCDLQLDSTLVRRTSGRNLGTFKQSSSFSESGEDWTERYLHIVWNEFRVHVVCMRLARYTKIWGAVGTNL